MLPFPSFTRAAEAEEDDLDSILDGLHRLWTTSPPADLDRYVEGLGDAATPFLVGLLCKIDLQYRRDRGEDASARDYLDRYAPLVEDPERAVSLIYEEFCLREESNASPDPDEFLDRYATWADSLASQLRYHRDLSMGAGREVRTRFPKVGDRFSKYELDSVLGQGGSACVFLAHDDALGGRKFVLKISQDRGSEPSILGKLTHRNIIPVHSVEVEPVSGLRGLRMPYYPGPPLDVVAKRIQAGDQPRSARELFELIRSLAGDPKLDTSGWADYPHAGTFEQGVAWIGLKLAEALAYSHARGILHRDVKPANVLLSIEYGPQLLDFNLAHAPNSAEEAEVALRGGTLPYMSPEQLRAFQDPDRWDDLGPCSDIYSLGLVLDELLTGVSRETRGSRLPLPRALQAAIDDRALPRVPLHKRIRGVSKPLSDAVETCLARNPDQRFASADKLADALRPVVAPRKQRAYLVPTASLLLFASVLVVPRLSESVTILRGTTAYREGRHDEALGLLLPVAESDPNRVDLLVWCADASEKIGARERANQLYRRAAEDPRSIPALRELVERNGNSVSAHMNLGQAYFKQNDYAAAESEFVNAVRIAPDMINARQALYVCHFERNDWSNALKDLEILDQLHRKSGRVSSRLPSDVARIALQRVKVLERMGDGVPPELLDASLARAEAARGGDASRKIGDITRRETGLILLLRAARRRVVADRQGAEADLDKAWSLRDEGASTPREVAALRSHFQDALERNAAGN